MRLGCNLRVPSLLVKSDDCELARAASDSFEITMTLMPSHGPASGRRFHLAPNPRMVPPSHHLYTPRRAAGWVRSPKFGPRGSALCVLHSVCPPAGGLPGRRPRPRRPALRRTAEHAAAVAPAVLAGPWLAAMASPRWLRLAAMAGPQVGGRPSRPGPPRLRVHCQGAYPPM